MSARLHGSTCLLLLATLGAALVVACSFRPDLSAYPPCSEGNLCPAGFRCLEAEQLCLPECGEQDEDACAPNPDDGGADDAGLDAGADAGPDDAGVDDAGAPDAGDAGDLDGGEDAGVPLTLTNTTLPPAYDLAPYSHAFSATGGTEPYLFDLAAGSLPAGLELDAGVLSGVPTTLGTSHFTVRVRDAADAGDEQPLTLTVQKQLRNSSPAQLPDTDANAMYSHQLYPTGGTPPFSWALIGGNVNVNTQTGEVTWAPTGSGTSFQVRLADSSTPQQIVVKTHTIDINNALDLTAVYIRNRDLADGRIGEFYSQKLEHRGPATVTWSIIPSNGLPPGLSLNAGVISGTPTTAGDWTFTLHAKGGTLGSTDTQSVTMTIF